MRGGGANCATDIFGAFERGKGGGGFVGPIFDPLGEGFEVDGGCSVGGIVFGAGDVLFALFEEGVGWNLGGGGLDELVGVARFIFPEAFALLVAPELVGVEAFELFFGGAAWHLSPIAKDFEDLLGLFKGVFGEAEAQAVSIHGAVKAGNGAKEEGQEAKQDEEGVTHGDLFSGS